MKFSSALLFTAAASVVSASAIPLELEEKSVERVTPFFSYKACGSLSDVLHVDTLTLVPNPPHKGKNTIKVVGKLNSDVTQGTKIEIRAKVGFMTVYHKTMDLCDLAKQKMGMSCPIKAGPLTIEKEFEIPSRIPHAKVNVALTGKTHEGKPLTCYNLQVGI